MEKEAFIRQLSCYGKLSVGLEAYLKYCLEAIHFSARQKISLSQTGFGGLGYLHKGSARLYLYDDDSEQELTLLFLTADKMIPQTIALAAYLKMPLYIDFLEDTVIYSISDKHLTNTYKLFNEAFTLSCAIDAQAWAGTIIAFSDLKLLTAAQRLEKLLLSFPAVFRLTAVKNVASYLGIHPTTLSGMRKKLSNSKRKAQ